MHEAEEASTKTAPAVSAARVEVLALPAPEFARLTFPRYRSLVAPVEPSAATRERLAVGSWLGDTPVGLALLSRPLGQGDERRLLSIYVHPLLRRRGLGTRLLAASEEIAAAHGAGRLGAVHASAMPARAAFEALLGRAGWSAPVEIERRAAGHASWATQARDDWAPLLARLDREGYRSTLWRDLADGERERIAAIVDADPSPAARDLDPLAVESDLALVPELSLVLRCRDEVVGWVLACRGVEAGSFHYSHGYVVPALRRPGWLVGAMRDVCARQVERFGGDTLSIFDTSPANPGMSRFIERRLRPYVLWTDSRYRSEKAVALSPFAKAAPSRLIEERLAAISRFVAELARRIEVHDPRYLPGPVQFTLTAPVRAAWHLLPGDGRVLLVEGRHDHPRWEIEAPLAPLARIAAGTFAWGDPASLASFRFHGDLIDFSQRLNAFLEPDRVAVLLRRCREIEQRAASLGLRDHGDVVRREELSEDELERAREELCPVLFARGLGSWPVWRWTFAGLAGRCRDTPFFDLSRNDDPTTLGTALTRVASGEAVGRRSYGAALPDDLARDLLPGRLRRFRAREAHLWLAPEGNVTPLHRDAADAISLQVLGRKRWRVFSPEQAGLLYLGLPIEDYQPSLADLRHPDLERHPDLARARSFEFTVAPGEVLFNPAGWLHEVEALEPALSVTLKLEPRAAPSAGGVDVPG